jgi:hypothetical protein
MWVLPCTGRIIGKEAAARQRIRRVRLGESRIGKWRLFWSGDLDRRFHRPAAARRARTPLETRRATATFTLVVKKS